MIGRILWAKGTSLQISTQKCLLQLTLVPSIYRAGKDLNTSKGWQEFIRIQCQLQGGYKSLHRRRYAWWERSHWKMCLPTFMVVIIKLLDHFMIHTFLVAICARICLRLPDDIILRILMRRDLSKWTPNIQMIWSKSFHRISGWLHVVGFRHVMGGIAVG